MIDLTPETLAELRRLLVEAPPLPYQCGTRTHGLPSDGPTYVALEAQHEGRWEEVATGDYERWSGTGLELATAAVNALPALLDAATELAHMREARDNARAEVERLTAMVDAAEASLKRAREPHRESHGSMSALYPNLICECGKDYPCPTIVALDATPETGGES